MNWTRLAVLTFAAAGAALSNPALAQWSSDPANNLKIADRSGEQVQPKVAPTPDGGAYVSWYDNGVTNYKRDSWTWSGTAWTKAATTGPDARYRHAMAYDGSRQRTVLFGGADATNSFSDTWEWNGTSWTQIAIPGPAGRSALAMAYDAARTNIVLFGGVDGLGNVDGDTWTFNGTAWTHALPAHSPSARQGHAMAYDSARNVVVLFGGQDQSGASLSDTWEWNGTDWTQAAPSLFPQARSGHGMSFDPVTNQIILFGGQDGGAARQDTWLYDGTNWSNPIPTTLPNLRYNCAMAQEFTASGTRVVVFGGFSGSFNVASMFEWSGTNWASKATTPNARNGPAMAFHAANNTTVMFGGQDTGGYDVFLQRLSAAGVEQWGHNGILIADRVVSSTVDYSLGCDQSGNAVIVFNDDRPAVAQITLQKVSPSGTLLFGTPGINVGAGSTGGSPPTVAVLSDGNYGVIWNSTTSPVSTNMQKVDSNTGALLWNGGAPVVQADWLSPARPVQASDCQPDDVGGMTVLFVKCTGTNCVTSNKQLFAQRYNALGAPVWNAGVPLTIFAGTSSIQTATFPRFIHDGAGGAVFGWYENGSSRNAYIQHVLADGTFKFPAPIANTGVTAGRIRIGASPAYNRATGNYFLASSETGNPTQTNYSVIVQRFDPMGNLMWGNGGIEIISQSTTFQASFAQCFTAGDGCVVSYIWQDNTVNGYVNSARISGEGSILWSNQTSSQFTSKSRLSGALGACGEYAILGWGNSPSGSVDIAVQNVNFDGTIGPAAVCPSFTTQPPSAAHPCTGGTLTLTAASAGSPCYQWRKGGVALSNGDRISGANSGTLTITGVLASDAGSYDVVASNTCSDVASTATAVSICAADYNCDNTLSVADIFDFLAGWFASNPHADFNGVGGISVADIFDFLNAWFIGC